jgi:hypothetical protein
MVLSAKTQVEGIINLLLTVVIMGCVITVLADAVPRWISRIRGKQESVQAVG